MAAISLAAAAALASQIEAARSSSVRASPLAHLAESFGMHCEIHGNGAPNLAVCGAIRNTRWYERGLLHPFLDYDELPPYLLRQIDPLDADGCVPMPPGPGLGEEIDHAYIAAHAVATY